MRSLSWIEDKTFSVDGPEVEVPELLARKAKLKFRCKVWERKTIVISGDELQNKRR